MAWKQSTEYCITPSSRDTLNTQNFHLAMRGLCVLCTSLGNTIHSRCNPITCHFCTTLWKLWIFHRYFFVLELVPANCTESLIYKKKLHLNLVKLWTTFYILFETLSGLRIEFQTPLSSFKTLQARIRTNRNPNTCKAL